MVDERAQAIERLYHARYAQYRRGAAAIVGADDAHDVVQDAFARALIAREQRRTPSLEAWVWRIVVRKALDRRRPRALVPVEDDLDPGLIESTRDPELAEAIRMLSPRRRLIVFLRYFADCSYAEIAALCGIAEGTVAAALSQAHEELRNVLALEEVEG